MSIPKTKDEFGAGVIAIKRNSDDFIALILNGGIVDSSWSKLADSVGIRSKVWWVFKFPVENAKVENNTSIILTKKTKGFGFDDEVHAIEKFDSLSEKKIKKIVPSVLRDKEL